MPVHPPAHRLLHVGSYTASTAGQLQGASGNKTTQYLAGMDRHDPGQQGFYREALTGIANPLDAKQTMSYGQLQDALAGPHKAQMLDAYAMQHKLAVTPSSGEYQQAMFDQAHAAMLERGAANPGVLAFSDAADAARRAPSTARAISLGNYVQPEGGQVVNAASQAQRFDQMPAPDGTAYTAPGMAVPAPPVATAGRRPIRGNIATN